MKGEPVSLPDDFTTDLAPPASALVIAAHPDDAEFQCGATLAKWAAADTVVSYLICTDGSKGTWDPATDTDALVATRAAEQRAAAAAIGASGEVLFLGRTDGELTNDQPARDEVAAHIRRLRPTVVLGHDPWKRYRLHPDHRRAGELTVEACVAARDPFFFPHHPHPPHRPEALLLFEPDEPNHAETADGWAQAKVAALLCHRSQFETTHGIADADDASQLAAFAAKVAERLTESGRNLGLAAAELYRRMTL